MIRTQVFLTEQQVRDIKLKARQEQKPAAQVIRELVDRGLHATRTQTETTGASLLRLAKIGGHAPADASTRIDAYLYGKDTDHR